MGEFRKLFGPSQLVEEAAQMDEQVDTGCRRQRRRLRAQARHPAEEMRLAAQLVERADLGMSGGEVGEKLADGAVVVTSRVRKERGAERADRAVEDRSQRMEERGASPHEAVTGSGRMCWATARAYCR